MPPPIMCIDMKGERNLFAVGVHTYVCVFTFSPSLERDTVHTQRRLGATHTHTHKGGDNGIHTFINSF